MLSTAILVLGLLTLVAYRFLPKYIRFFSSPEQIKLHGGKRPGSKRQTPASPHQNTSTSPPVADRDIPAYIPGHRPSPPVTVESNLPSITGDRPSSSAKSKPFGVSRIAMAIVVSTAVLLSALYIILSQRFEVDSEKWAFGAIGTIVGFWLRPED